MSFLGLFYPHFVVKSGSRIPVTYTEFPSAHNIKFLYVFNLATKTDHFGQYSKRRGCIEIAGLLWHQIFHTSALTIFFIASKQYKVPINFFDPICGKEVVQKTFLKHRNKDLVKKVATSRFNLYFGGKTYRKPRPRYFRAS